MSILIERETSAGSAGARRATRDPAGRDAAGVEDPEVREQAKRRRFSAEYKLRIVREADACKGDGDVAALLRREGLYSSLLSSWRRQRDEIAKVGMTSRKRGRKAKAEDPRVKELERENARLQRRHPNYTKPELLAEAPNQVWSWDITKLRGPVKWTYYPEVIVRAFQVGARYVIEE